MSTEKNSNGVATLVAGSSAADDDKTEAESLSVVVRRNRALCSPSRCCSRGYSICEGLLSSLWNFLSRCCVQRELELPIIDNGPLIQNDVSHEGHESTCDTVTSIAAASRDTSIGLCGLVNLGHTCFMNSALQCLSSTTPLRKYLIDDLSYPEIMNESGSALTISFSNLLKKMWSKEHSLVSQDELKELKELIGRTAERFAGYTQEDSQEFLNFLLEGLHEDLNRPLPEIDEDDLVSNQNLSEKEQAELAWKWHLQENNSMIVKLFQGQLKTRLTCGSKKCGKEISLEFDPFMFLALPLPDEVEERDGNHISYNLQDCLSLMIKETCSEKEDWFCEHCESDVPLKRKIDIWKLPEILIVHLKRFRATLETRYKMETSIEYPLELDLTSFMGIKQHYELFAVIDHYGSIHGGHYTATTLHNSEWYRFNDETFQHLKSVKEIKNSCAVYVLFYERKSSDAKPTKVTDSESGVSMKQMNDIIMEMQEFV